MDTLWYPSFASFELPWLDYSSFKKMYVCTCQMFFTLL
jgi:hypothetical protein